MEPNIPYLSTRVLYCVVSHPASVPELLPPLLPSLLLLRAPWVPWGALTTSPLLLPSCPFHMSGNAFLLRVSVSSRDFLCDGRPFGLSAHMFRAISRRQHERLGLQVNDAWLEGEGEGGKENGEGTAKERGAEGGGKRSSLAWGHLINDPQGSGGRPNVAFRTIRVTVAASAAPAAPASSFPPSFPPSLLPSLPTLSASGNNARERVVIAVVAVEAMEGGAEGKELFVQYSQDPTHLGYI